MRLDLLLRLTRAIERLSTPPRWGETPSLSENAFFWHPQDGFEPIDDIAALSLDLLKGIDAQRHTLYDNTHRFAQGFCANNALLWGSRGMGKSALVKAIYRHLRTLYPLVLIEIDRKDLHSLPRLQKILRSYPRRVIIFCDDLSFESADTDYKSLKTILEGGIESRPSHLLFYATSNRRHLLPRAMIENESVAAIHAHEVIDEKVSLADRFGLWIGFHPCDQDTYLAMVEGYAQWLELPIEPETLRQEALAWSLTRAGRSGRIAWQFIQVLAGRLGRSLP